MEATEILIVDDDPAIAEMMTVFLEDADYRTCHVADGYAALTAIEQRQPALVLTNEMHSEPDGYHDGSRSMLRINRQISPTSLAGYFRAR